MLGKIEELIRNIENSQSPKLSIIPFSLIIVFDSYYAPEIGKLMLEMRAKGISFNFEEEEVEDYTQAFELVKTKESAGEKIVYALRFLGLFNRVTRKGTEKLIDNLMGRDV